VDIFFVQQEEEEANEQLVSFFCSEMEENSSKYIGVNIT